MLDSRPMIERDSANRLYGYATVRKRKPTASKETDYWLLVLVLVLLRLLLQLDKFWQSSS